jgi:predicted GNAT family N-acyltransferase
LVALVKLVFLTVRAVARRAVPGRHDCCDSERKWRTVTTRLEATRRAQRRKVEGEERGKTTLGRVWLDREIRGRWHGRPMV